MTKKYPFIENREKRRNKINELTWVISLENYEDSESEYYFGNIEVFYKLFKYGYFEIEI